MSPRRKKGTPPPYRPHATGQAFAVWEGNHYYFGKYGTPASHRKYEQFLARWRDAQLAQGTPLPEGGCTVAELAAAYLTLARKKYVLDGEPTSELANLTNALKGLLRDCPDRPADDFRPRDLERLREGWAAAGLSRATVGIYTTRVVRLFRWGTAAGHVAPSVLALLTAQKRDPVGRETEPIPAVPEAVLRATLAELDPLTRSLVQWQWYVGCRPDEACRLRGEEIDRQGLARLERGRTVQLQGVWVFQPRRFKTKRRKRVLTYLVGPKARAILEPLLPADPAAWVFPGRDGDRLRAGTYGHRIRYACQRAGLDVWGPNQLRHAALTRYDEEAGIVAASGIVQHDRLDTTAVYVEKRLQQSAELVRRLG